MDDDHIPGFYRKAILVIIVRHKQPIRYFILLRPSNSVFRLYHLGDDRFGRKKNCW
jgi:hypothetical protein